MPVEGEKDAVPEEKPLRYTYPQTEEEFLTRLREVLEPVALPDPEELAEMTLEERAANEEMSLGYEHSANAMWKAALLAFNYAAHVHGTTGFQGSWAALRFYGEVMGIDGPYAVITGEKMLYPQYDIQRDVATYLESWKPWAAEEARKKMAKEREENPAGHGVHPDVWARWEELAALHPEEAEATDG